MKLKQELKNFSKKHIFAVEKWDSKALIFRNKVFIKEKKKEKYKKYKKYGNNIGYIKNRDYSDEFELKPKKNNKSDSGTKNN